MEIVTLKNGIRIVLEHMPSLRSVCLGIWIKNGSRHEDESQGGISHFIEHMLFKGTNNRSAKDIADEIDAIGGQINAYTSKEYTCYYTRTLDEHFPKSIDILADMFFNSTFDDREIEKEKNVIIEEINMYEDTPDEVAHDLLQYSIWKGCTLANPILGTKDVISSFNSETFKDYFNKKYTAQNIIVAVAGNFSKQPVVDLIKNYFEGYDLKGDTNKPSNTIYKKSIVTKEKDIEQLHIQLGFPSIKMSDRSIYAMGALNTLFGGGMSSRLFQTIREEHGLAYSVYSYNSSYEDVGLFSIYASLIKENAKEVISHIFSEIKGLNDNKITKDQLNRTKEQLKSNYILSLESSSSRMSNIGRSLTMLNRVLVPDKVLQEIEEITLDSIYSLYQDIFNNQNISLSVVGPTSGMDFKLILEDAML